MDSPDHSKLPFVVMGDVPEEVSFFALPNAFLFWKDGKWWQLIEDEDGKEHVIPASQ